MAAAVRRRKNTSKFKVKAWWHHSYLQVLNRGKEFVMDIGKAWIDGLAKDMAYNRLTPADFRLVATFEPINKVNPMLEALYTSKSSSAGFRSSVDSLSTALPSPVPIVTVPPSPLATTHCSEQEMLGQRYSGTTPRDQSTSDGSVVVIR